jgi:hypothetical protein
MATPSMNAYLDSLLSQKTVLDHIYVSLNGENPAPVPRIITASILLTERMSKAGTRTTFIFPEYNLCAFEYTLVRTLLSISEGRVVGAYDPHSFKPGEKLKFKNSVMEFIGIETGADDIERIVVKFAGNLTYHVPIQIAPYLQHAETKRLSNQSAFAKAKKEHELEKSADATKSLSQKLHDYKTHFDTSTLFIAPMMSSRALFSQTTINNEKTGDLLLLAQADLEGKISNLSAGQLSGIPAIVLCPDLYAANEVIDNGLSISGVCIASTDISIDAQLDALDDLLQKQIPVTLLSDKVHFSNYGSLEQRDFSLWVWDSATLASTLIDSNTTSINTKTKNSMERQVKYICLECPEISDTITRLYRIKNTIKDQSPATISIYQVLFENALHILRTITPILNRDNILEALRKCRKTLLGEKKFLSDELGRELECVITNLAAACADDSTLPKISAMEELVRTSEYSQIIVIVPQSEDKYMIETHLGEFSESGADILVVHPTEYLELEASQDRCVVICSWLNKEVISKVFNSNLSPSVDVLLYEVEAIWKKHYAKTEADSSRRDASLTKKSLNVIGQINDEHVLDADSLIPYNPQVNNEPEEASDSVDAIEGIEIMLRQNKYSQYSASTGESNVSAIPISYVGDYLAFYKTSHTLLTATRILNEGYDRPEEVKPAALANGDFVIERESQRSIIRDIADVILKNSGCLDLRELAEKWREALSVESAFSDEDTIYHKLRDAGCTRGKLTVHSWLNDDNMITPQSKNDITFIAEATDDIVLLELADKVFEAGKRVKSAHLQAGHYLAEKLKASLAIELSSMKGIDEFSVWNPIEITVEGIGTVRILKVIDIGAEMLVEATTANRLINTNRAFSQSSWSIWQE